VTSKKPSHDVPHDVTNDVKPFFVADAPKAEPAVAAVAELSPIVAAVVHILRTYHYREMTFDDIERVLRTHPDATIRNGPAYRALTFAVDSGLAVASANKSRRSGSGGMKVYGPATTDWQPPPEKNAAAS
jgi:hypothetical protein